MPGPEAHFIGITRTVSSRLKELRGSTPEVMKAFGELGRAATADVIFRIASSRVSACFSRT